jgi:O-antigen ligase
LVSICIFVFLYGSVGASRALVGQRERVLAAVMWLGALCSVLCLAQLMFGYDGVLGSPEQRAMQAEGVLDTFWPGIERGSATLNGPSAAGAFCAIAGVIALTRTLTQNSRIRDLTLAVLCAGGVLATFSRGALLGLLAGCAFACWAMGFLSRRRLWLVGGLVASLLFLGFATENVRNYLRLGSDLVSVSESRVDAWQATRIILAHHPIFGIGFYEFRDVAQGIEGFSDTPLHPHNGFLKALVEEGPVGGLGYLLYVAFFLRFGLRAIRGNGEKDFRWAHGAIAGAGVSLFTQELFDANLTVGGSSIAILFATLLGLQVSLSSAGNVSCETLLVPRPLARQSLNLT